MKPSPGERSRVPWLAGIAGALLAAFLCAALPAWAAPPGGPGDQAPPPAVIVAIIIEKDVNPPLDFVGKVEAVQAVDLRARVQGFLRKVAFTEGSQVQAGDLMYVIEQDLYQAGVDLAKAKVAEAEASLTKAQQYLRRVKMTKPGSVSVTDVETAQANEEAAIAVLAEAKANLEEAKINYGYTTIEAPITGRVGHTAITRGNLVGPSSGILARIVQTDPIRVVYSITENRLPEIQEARGASGEEGWKTRVVHLRLPDGRMYPLAGKIEFMDNQVDYTTGTIAFRALFDNPQAALIPGQYVTVVETARQPRLMAVVPQAAVLEDREGRYVFVVDNKDQAELRRIVTGPEVGTDWVAEKGLKAGERIIVEGLQKVRPGQPVKPELQKAK
ncbi:MAG: efflux RND transporter periplasmic adaptor subunit [Deltaproteobacteria bacterium]|nr:efflux RND transporter periplasmic adaptor subunit [Deltaproteobacteria bacterium]